jgi:Mor family transcriptional regulator
MTQRDPPILTRLIRAAAERLAHDACIPDANREAFRQTCASLLHAQFSLHFGGERIYAPRESSWLRMERRQRIEQALQRGDTPPQVARREGVSLRWVQRVRKDGANTNS